MTIAKEYSFTVYRKRIYPPLSLWFSGSLCQYAYRQPYLTPDIPLRNLLLAVL